MSLEEAAKELEKLELRMHQRAVGNEDEGGGEMNTPAKDCGFNNKSTVRASVGEAEGESKDGDDDVKMNRDSGDVFQRRRPVSTEGRKGCPAMGERGENGGFPHGDRSPTRTPPHNHNTGCIDIEGQGHLASPSRPRSQNTVGLSASGTAIVDAWRCSRDAPWVAGEVDRDGGVKSSFGGDNLSFSAVGAKGVGEISRGIPRGWRNEADVDLSDIKAAMRRIDGVGAGEMTDGYVSNTFAFDTRASIAGAAAAASSRSATGPPFAAGVSLDREPFASRAYGARDVRLGSDLFSSSIAAGGRMGEGSGKWGGDFGRSPCSGASYGSKAVLGSLRALQDKIRKLESERDRASVEAGTLRREIAALKSNHERAAQISEAQVQEKTLASRLAYERLQADKIAVDVRLRKAEEHKNLLMREAEAAKERSATAEAARQTAESRVRILEDSLKGSGRQHEETRAAEARAVEEATASAREKADKIEALRSKVEKLEVSVAAEKTLHEEAEDRLKQALSDKGKLEHFLEGILRVNEELVKAKANDGRDKTRTKVKRPKVVMTAHCGGGRGGGGHEREDFNFGTHTAKRATLRARKGMVKKKRVAGAAAGPSTRGVPQQRKSTSTCKVAKKGSIVKNGRARSAAVEVAVPFVASGSGKDSFNVVSAVSKAVRAARRGRPHESLDVIYAEIEKAAVENTRDVASMFDGGNGGTSCRQQRRSQIRSPRRAASTDRKGRAVLDVSMPDLRGLNLDSPNFSDQRSVETDDREDGLEASESNCHWRRAIGLDEAPKTPSRREGDQRRKVGVLRRGTQGGDREHPEECYGYREAYYGMWSSGRFGDVADVDGKGQEDKNEDKQHESNGRGGARFGSQAGGGKGSPAMDAGMSSGDERKRAWESLDSRTRSRSSRLA